MINHARTLLMNRSGGKQNLNELGEEYIPIDFMSQSLTPWLSAYQRVLFGSNPENVYRNFQADRLLRLVHATEYEPYLTLFDSRLTYDPHESSPFSKTQYGYSFIAADEESGIREVNPAGNYSADESTGVMQYQWIFSVVDQVANITYTRSGETSTIRVVAPPEAGRATSDIVALPGTGFKIRLRIKPNAGGSYPIAAWTQNFSIYLLARPASSLADKIDELESLRLHENNLFGVSSAQPYSTFASLWRTAKSLPDRISGIVLALLYRLHEHHRSRIS